MNDENLAVSKDGNFIHVVRENDNDGNLPAFVAVTPSENNVPHSLATPRNNLTVSTTVNSNNFDHAEIYSFILSLFFFILLFFAMSHVSVH